MFNKKYQSIHFVGIGGIGMSGIAEVLINLGYQVSGSDLKRSVVTEQLEKKGARVFYGHQAGHVNGAHLVVTSSAVSETNPEVRKAKKNGLSVIPRAEMLAELMRMKYGIAVAGTHGKTTTTSLIGLVLSEAGLDPTLIIGGRVNHLKSNARLGQGEFLVAEADESDRSFLKLTPTIAVVTNIDPEHMENYKNFAEVRESFITFANKVPFYGAVVACADHPQVRKIFPQLNRPLVTYGVRHPAEYTATHIAQKGMQMSFLVHYRQELLGPIELHQPGIHHVGNALAAVAVARELGIPFPQIAAGLKKFNGVERRFQVMRQADPIVVDDYAHHPVEIAATLEAARAGWQGFKIGAIIQPHRFSRLRLLFDDFADVLRKFDWVGVLPVYAAGEKPLRGVNGKKLAEKIQKLSPALPVHYAEEMPSLRQKLQGWVDEKTMVLCLGAGSIHKMTKEMTEQWNSQ